MIFHRRQVGSSLRCKPTTTTQSAHTISPTTLFGGLSGRMMRCLLFDASAVAEKSSDGPHMCIAMWTDGLCTRVHVHAVSRCTARHSSVVRACLLIGLRGL